ncbi:nuclear transport factor 2 family protein [uncultured Enterovirga sp.]|uniref:nuclear transport factor 2 family protein n=1 Tax=uncultured Enterovirga sp. TaxID=2026352 RepID=UPI0035C96404
MKDAVEQLIRSAYRARMAGNVDEIMGHFGDAAHFALNGSTAASPFPVAVAGKAAIREVMGRLVSAFEFSDAEILNLIVEGSDAAVHWRVRIRGPQGGEPVETELVDIVRIDGGKIASIKQFADTALAAHMLKS